MLSVYALRQLTPYFCLGRRKQNQRQFEQEQRRDWALAEPPRSVPAASATNVKSPTTAQRTSLPRPDADHGPDRPKTVVTDPGTGQSSVTQTDLFLNYLFKYSFLYKVKGFTSFDKDPSDLLI